MRLKLGLSAREHNEDTCVIVVEVIVDDESITVGALADAVHEVLDIRSDQMEPPPKLGTSFNTRFIDGMGKIEDQFLIFLNIDKLFNSDEMATVKDTIQSKMPEELEVAKV